MKRKILITGSNGFIGKNLIKYLKETDYEIYGIDLYSVNNNNYFNVNINDYDNLNKIINLINPETVIHLAARIDISNDSVWEYETNIVGVQNLIRITESTESVKRVIWTSTQLVNKLGTNFIDYNFYNANTTYGSSKVIGELLVKNGVKNKEWIIVRPSTVWGPGMSNHYLNFIKYIEKGFYFNITNKKVHKSFAYIGNICFQYKNLIDQKSELVNKKTFYLSDYHPIELHEWTNEINKNLKKKLLISLPLFLSYLIATIFYFFKFFRVIKKVPISFYNINNISTSYINNTDLENLTGTLPYNMKEAVFSTIDWYKNEN